MNIDRPGFDTLSSDRIALGAAILEADRAALGFDEDFVAGSGFPAGEEDFFAERVFDGSRGDLVAGRFLFSGMPLEIIPSVGGCDQLDQSTPFTVELYAPTVSSKNRRIEGYSLLEERGLAGPRYRVLVRRPQAGVPPVQSVIIFLRFFVSSILRRESRGPVQLGT